MERKQIKEWGKNAFKANYWPCVAVAFIMSIVAGGSGGSLSFRFNGNSNEIDASEFRALMDNPDVGKMLMIMIPIIVSIAIAAIAIGIVIRVFLVNPLLVGTQFFFRINTASKASFDLIGAGFNKLMYMRNVKAMFLVDLFVFLWSLLFFIPGIIKSYSYRLTSFILSENPQMTHKEAMELSEQMMDGHKMEAFVLDLSFIGWHLLGILTLGILEIFYVLPYQYNTNAAFYESLKGKTMPAGQAVM